jgi:hypothetical protein
MLSLSKLACVCAAMPLVAQTNVLTNHNDTARTGANLNEIILTTANVNSAQFGKLFLTTLDGRVDAQPLYVSGVSVSGQGTHNVLIAATENDSLYAVDADSGAQLWQAVLLKSGETASDDIGCGQITPQIGITSTPVIHLNRSGNGGTIYAEAMSKDSTGAYHHRLHAIDLGSGTEVLGGPTEITATYPGTGAGSQNGTVYFQPLRYAQRPGLLLMNGVVYIAFGSHCDHPAYTGWIMGYSASTLAQMTVLNVTPNGSDGAIWQAGAGLAADKGNNIYFLDANGTFDTTLNAQGFPANGNYGNSFMKVSTAGNQLAVADYFAMYNTVTESENDLDLGSGGAMVLPEMRDSTGAKRQLVIGAGKDSHIYIADTTNMGKFNSQNNSNLYQEVYGALQEAVRGGPAYYNGQVYFGPRNKAIMAFRFHKARLAVKPESVTSIEYPYPGATPSISANGDTNGILWAVESAATAVLHAYLAGDLGTELYNSSQAAGGRDQFGAGNKFMVPTIVNGKVYVGTPTGVAGFGLLPAARPAL